MYRLPEVLSSGMFTPRSDAHNDSIALVIVSSASREIPNTQKPFINLPFETRKGKTPNILSR
jgi:hypothetical protein